MLNGCRLGGKKILVTGGAGFLGRHLLPRLLANGAQVCCIVRSPKARLPEGVAAIDGDCANVADMERAVRGRDMVIHMAGLLFGTTWRDYLAANASMARNIALAVQKEPSARRVVFISSLAASGPSGQSPGRGESMAPAPVSAYGWSKLLAESILAEHLGDRLVILRPPIVYGSGDRGLLPLFRSCGRGYGVSPGHFPVSAIHAADCASAIILACLPDASGVYHLNDGAVYDMDGICQAIGRAQGRQKVRVLHPPLAFMSASASLSSAGYAAAAGIFRMFGWQAPCPPAWNRDKFRESAQAGWLADAGRITGELGFRPGIDINAGMAEAVAGYRREGWL